MGRRENAGQSIKGNSGNAFNISGGINNSSFHVVSGSASDSSNHFDIDWTPSSVGRKVPVNKGLWTSFLMGSISLVSGIFGIFGLDVHKIKIYLDTMQLPSGWWHSTWLAVSVALFIVSTICLIFLLWLKFFKGFRYLGTDWVNMQNTVFPIVYRRKCPHCGGVMEAKIVASKANPNEQEPNWVCQRNPRLHRIEFDHTQIEEAWKKGKLSFLL